MVVVAFPDQLPDLHLRMDTSRPHLPDRRTRKIPNRCT
jgi:hypothetical protein